MSLLVKYDILFAKSKLLSIQRVSKGIDVTILSATFIVRSILILIIYQRIIYDIDYRKWLGQTFGNHTTVSMIAEREPLPLALLTRLTVPRRLQGK